jgi:NADPH:quinone reductase-like Zn-dependent oxidoreductase
LVNGASGSVGLCAVQIAKMMGATVVGVCSGRNIALVQSYGADRVIDYTKTDITQLKEQFDLVFDCVSTLQFKACKSILTPHGQYINLMLRPLDLLWQRIRNPFFNQKLHTVLMAYRPDDIAWVVQKIEQKAFQIPTDAIYPLKDIQAAHEYLESGRAKGKILLEMSPK